MRYAASVQRSRSTLWISNSGLSRVLPPGMDASERTSSMITTPPLYSSRLTLPRLCSLTISRLALARYFCFDMSDALASR